MRYEQQMIALIPVWQGGPESPIATEPGPFRSDSDPQVCSNQLILKLESPTDLAIWKLVETPTLSGASAELLKNQKQTFIDPVLLDDRSDGASKDHTLICARYL